eukprot:scaffold20843_cov112-Isochrysis_galbana.AAC.1
MPASERGALAMANVSDVRLPIQDWHGNPVAQAPARLIRYSVGPAGGGGGRSHRGSCAKTTTPRTQCHGAESSRGRDPSAAPANCLWSRRDGRFEEAAS